MNEFLIWDRKNGLQPQQTSFKTNPNHLLNTHRRATLPLRDVWQDVLPIDDPEGARENALPEVRAKVPIAFADRREGRLAPIVRRSAPAELPPALQPAASL